jgi:uncharacterized protein YkwD
MKRAAALLALVAATSAGTAEARADASCPHADDVPLAASLDAARAATICLVNAERREHGLRAVRSARRLDSAARRHARAMVRDAFFAHAAPDGDELVDRLRRARYLPRHGRWRAGENIAWGTGALATPRAVVDAWLASPGHRAVLLDRAWRELGVAVAAGAPVAGVTGGVTYTADFGRRNS